MFNFINSLVLPLIAAALIPLLLHLLNRKKLKIVPFSSLRFLKELQSKRVRQIKLYQLLIILLRMLFIIFLVLAFARPTVRHFLGGKGGQARTTAVIILDNSYSMQAQQGLQSLFGRAKLSLKTILQSFNPNDHITILLPLPDSLQQLTVSKKNRLSVKRLKPTNYSPDFSSVVMRAKSIFKRFPNFNRELYLITDGKIPTTALNDSARKILKHLNARIYIINTAANIPLNNISIDSAAIQTRLAERQKPVTVSVTLENHASQTKQITVSLFDGTARMAMQLVSLPAQSKRRISLRFTPGHTGFFPLKVEIDDDDLLADNAYYLALFIPESVPVLYVQNQIPVELREALNTLSDRSNLKIRQSDYNHWYGEPLADFQLLVLNDPPQITQTFLMHLRRFLDSGHDVILIPGMRLTPTAYNRLTNQLLSKNLFKELVKVSDQNHYFTLGTLSSGTNLFGNLFENRPAKIEWPPFYQYFKLTPSGRILLRFTNGDPFLSRFSFKTSGHLWLFSAGLSMPWNRLPVSGIFLPFLHRLLSLAANNDSHSEHFIVGQPISVFLNNLKLQGSFRLIPPEGQAVIIIPRQTFRGLRFDFDGFARPGHYKIFHNKKPVRLFAVNLSKREWSKPYFNLARFRPDIRLLSPDKLSIKKLKSARSGKELWPYFLLLALMMLLLEMMLIKKLEGKPESALSS